MADKPQSLNETFDDTEDRLGEIAKKVRKDPTQKNLEELQRVSEEGDLLLGEILKQGENS